jgi:hypothetical protein
MFRFACCASLTLALLVAPTGAARAAEVDWRAPARCPDAEEVRFRMERAIGMPLAHAAPLRFTVTAEARGARYLASVEVTPSPDAAEHRRELTASSCTELVDVVTIAVALALGHADAAPGADAAPDLTATARPGPGLARAAAVGARSEPSPPAPAPQPNGSALDTAEHGMQSGGTRARWSPGIGVWLLGDSGSLPEPGLGLALDARLRHRRWVLRATGAWYWTQHVALPELALPAPGADLGLLTGALSACLTPLSAVRGDSLEVLGCAGWEIGRTSGEGTGVQQPRSAAALWSAPKLDLGASIGVWGDLRLGAMLTLALPLARENFVLTDLGEVHRPPGAVGRAALGLEWAPR